MSIFTRGGNKEAPEDKDKARKPTPPPLPRRSTSPTPTPTPRLTNALEQMREAVESMLDKEPKP